MSTLRLTSSPSDLQKAVGLLHDGKLVAFPTETVYGLGALISQPTAVAAIFQAKGRPSDNPLIVHIADMKQLKPLLGELNTLQQDRLEKLAKAFWPGPLTLVLPKSATVPLEVTAGQTSFAVRWPSHSIAQQLITLAAVPIAAPSANTSGRPSPTTAQHVLDDLDGKIAAVIDGGPTNIGIESTVVDLTGLHPHILRPGHITREQLEEVLQTTITEHTLMAPTSSSQVPRSPGMKYRHYAPQANVIICQENQLALLADFDPQDTLILSNLDLTHSPFEVHPLDASSLFAEFRQADHDQRQQIVVITDPQIRLNSGLMNRILKAAAD